MVCKMLYHSGVEGIGRFPNCMGYFNGILIKDDLFALVIRTNSIFRTSGICGRKRVDPIQLASAV